MFFFFCFYFQNLPLHIPRHAHVPTLFMSRQVEKELRMDSLGMLAKYYAQTHKPGKVLSEMHNIFYFSFCY